MARKKLIKSEVIKIFSTTKETLRHYETLGLIEPEIDENNYRYYDHKELRKLRQIFFLRDMEIPLDEIAQLNSKDVSWDKYLEILIYHHNNLKKKAEKLKSILENTGQMIKMLEKQSYRRSFAVRYCRERYLFRLEASEMMEPPNIKSYLDQFSHLLDKQIYTERSFTMIYPYDNLKTAGSIDGIQCLEVGKKSKLSKDLITQFPEGYYLSVFYLYKDGLDDDLFQLYNEIEEYLQNNDWIIKESTVLEMEHPELSIIYDEDENVYELQILVEKACRK